MTKPSNEIISLMNLYSDALGKIGFMKMKKLPTYHLGEISK
jgi:hypothetical protein